MEENKSSDRRTLKTKKAIFQAFSELLKEKEHMTQLEPHMSAST